MTTEQVATNEKSSSFHFGLCFGWGARPLSEQLEAFGIGVAPNSKTVDDWQKDADAILRCVLRDVLTPSVAMTARNRLTRKIEKHLINNGHMALAGGAR